MRKIVILLISFFILSCGHTDQNTVIKEKISKKKEEIRKLENEIADLEKQLTDSLEVDQAVPVAVKKMSGEEFKHFIIVYGEVEAEKYAMISPEMGGQIKKIHIDEGEKVQANQLLVSLNTESIRNSIKQVKTNLELAVQAYEKQKALWDQNIGSEIQYLQAKTNKESLEAQLKSLKAQKRMAEIRAPFSGYVNNIFAKEGELAGAVMPVVEMVNLDIMTLTADISEEHIGKIKERQIVEVTFSSLPDIKLDIPIVRVSNVINRDNRTFEIELKFRNKGEKIKPHMVSKITINDFTAESAFVVPTLAIKQDISGKYVYTVKTENDKHVTKKSYITTGLSYNDQTMVEKGLNVGDEVIVKGYNQVSTGLPVAIK